MKYLVNVIIKLTSIYLSVCLSVRLLSAYLFGILSSFLPVCMSKFFVKLEIHAGRKYTFDQLKHVRNSKTVSNHPQ